MGSDGTTDNNCTGAVLVIDLEWLRGMDVQIALRHAFVTESKGFYLGQGCDPDTGSETPVYFDPAQGMDFFRDPKNNFAGDALWDWMEQTYNPQSKLVRAVMEEFNPGWQAVYDASDEFNEWRANQPVSEEEAEEEY